MQEVVKGDWESLTSISAKRSHSKLKAKSLRQLSAIDCPNLDSLIVSSSVLSTAAVEAMKQGGWPRLSFLDMSACGLTGGIFRSLVTAAWPVIELDLSYKRLDNNAITSLVFSQWCL